MFECLAWFDGRGNAVDRKNLWDALSDREWVAFVVVTHFVEIMDNADRLDERLFVVQNYFMP